MPTLTTTDSAPVSRRILLAAVAFAASVSLLVGAGVAWLVYRASGPAQLTPEIVTNTHGNSTTPGDLIASSEGSIVTIVTQPTTTGSLNSTAVSNGVVVTADGFIITSIDAVRGASQIRIGTSDGHGFSAIIVATDTNSGFVILHAVAAKNLRPLALASAGPRTGDAAIVISQPPTGGPTANVTTVAATAVTAGHAGNAFQLATMGNNDRVGAPIVDGSDHVIGVVSGASSATSGELADSILPSAANYLNNQTAIASPAFGLTYTFIPESTAGALGIASGALIDNASGPAAAAGVQPGDIVTAVNGTSVDAGHPLVPTFFGLAAGQPAKLTISRGGATQTITVTAA